MQRIYTTQKDNSEWEIQENYYNSQVNLHKEDTLSHFPFGSIPTVILLGSYQR